MLGRQVVDFLAELLPQPRFHNLDEAHSVAGGAAALIPHLAREVKATNVTEVEGLRYLLLRYHSRITEFLPFLQRLERTFVTFPLMKPLPCFQLDETIIGHY